MSNGLCKFLSEKPHKNQNSLSVIFSFRPKSYFSFIHFCFFVFFLIDVAYFLSAYTHMVRRRRALSLSWSWSQANDKFR
jgi:uncharacterized membrane protein YhaH (DUF805 family)